ncbi:MAG: hypothetical protein CSA62_04345 [Planctomycetota bacterium]|nr:MAG: hypothetical protein CSA62_04345 [Planctomycetota bacterium]
MSTLESTTRRRSRVQDSLSQPKQALGSSPKTAREKELVRGPITSGRQGRIVSAPQLNEEERQQLARLAQALDWSFYVELGDVAARAREVGRELEGLAPRRRSDEAQRPTRPSLSNLRRHAMRQWFDSVLEGREGESYERRLRSLYFPILVGDAGHDDVPQILVEHFLDYIEGYLTSWLFDRPHENLVPSAQLLHAFQSAMVLQRRANAFRDSES